MHRRRHGIHDGDDFICCWRRWRQWWWRWCRGESGWMRGNWISFWFVTITNQNLVPCFTRSVILNIRIHISWILNTANGGKSAFTFNFIIHITSSETYNVLLRLMMMMMMMAIAKHFVEAFIRSKVDGIPRNNWMQCSLAKHTTVSLFRRCVFNALATKAYIIYASIYITFRSYFSLCGNRMVANPCRIGACHSRRCSFAATRFDFICACFI